MKKELRHGIPQPYRRVVWLRLSGAEAVCRGDYDGYYDAATRLCFSLASPQPGQRVVVESIDGKYPTFGGELLHFEWLSSDDFEAAKRLLLVLQGFEDKLEYCPWLPSLLCCLLQVLTEAETYCVILALVDRSLRPGLEQPKLPHFLLTQQVDATPCMQHAPSATF